MTRIWITKSDPKNIQITIKSVIIFNILICSRLLYRKCGSGFLKEYQLFFIRSRGIFCSLSWFRDCLMWGPDPDLQIILFCCRTWAGKTSWQILADWTWPSLIVWGNWRNGRLNSQTSGTKNSKSNRHIKKWSGLVLLLLTMMNSFYSL